MLSTCVGVASSLTAAEVAMLTNAWAELLTPASVNDDTVGDNYITMIAIEFMLLCYSKKPNCNCSLTICFLLRWFFHISVLQIRNNLLAALNCLLSVDDEVLFTTSETTTTSDK